MSRFFSVWNEDEEARLAEMFTRGDGYNAISNELGRSKSSICNKANQLKLVRYTATWTDGRVAELTELRAAGLLAREIGAKLGLSKNSVISKLQRLKLPPPQQLPENRTVTLAPERYRGPTRAQREVVARETKVARPVLPPAMQKARGARFPTCQWIAGEPRANDECKCGRPTATGVYCAEHAVLSVRPAREWVEVAAL